jgi:AcrR family transcriptional regulator
MRVTAEVKEATNAAILAAARSLFLEHGVEGTSTRDIAKAAGVGVGTVFNYFESKEHLALAIASAAFEQGRAAALERLDRDAAGESSLEMALFTLVAGDLRALAPLRTLVGRIVDGALGRGAGPASSPAGVIRAERVGDAEQLLARHGVEASGALMHLYWSLYLGVLAFWSRDGSPKQEDSLAMLDQAIRMFTGVAAPGGTGGVGQTTSGDRT